MTVSVDFETRSTVDLKRTGVYKYAQDKSTDIWCMAYAFDDAEPKVWRPTDELDPELVEYVKNGGELRAWNANFERTIWNEILAKKYDWPKTSVTQWVCTAAEARAMALPGSLDMAAQVLGVQEQKDLVVQRIDDLVAMQAFEDLRQLARAHRSAARRRLRGAARGDLPAALGRRNPRRRASTSSRAPASAPSCWPSPSAGPRTWCRPPSNRCLWGSWRASAFCLD